MGEHSYCIGKSYDINYVEVKAIEFGLNLIEQFNPNDMKYYNHTHLISDNINGINWIMQIQQIDQPYIFYLIQKIYKQISRINNKYKVTYMAST